jgi:class 3 adenylate cyclase
MIRNIYYENIIDLLSLNRLSQHLIGTVLIIGCWNHVYSKLLALTLFFTLLIYQTAILVINVSHHIQISKCKWWPAVCVIDGFVSGVQIFLFKSNATLALGIFSLFVLIYVQTHGLKSIYAFVSLTSTILIFRYINFQPYHIDNFCMMSKLCEVAVFIILFVFLIIYSFAKNSYDHSLNYNLAKQFNTNRELKSHIFSLSKFLSPEISKSIFTGNQVRVESSEKKMTVFFSDMTNFCQLSEQLSNEKLTWLINSYLEAMSDIIFKFGGTLDKVIGDSIMVFFGDPHSRGESNDALACVTMAQAMNEAMQKLRHQWLESGIENPPNLRIGINTGCCKVGNFGTETKLAYTVMGTAVNLASHIESVAKSNEIVLSEQTYQLVKDRIKCERKQDDSEWLTKSLRLYSVI